MRWTDVADWIGPTDNETPGGMVAHRGLVLHIQEGSEQGTEAWQRSPASQISSHFLAPKVGRLRQMVDTGDKAWTEAAGNPYWLSVEIEGRHGDALTVDQFAGIAHLYAKGMQVYGWPLAATDNPLSGAGLIWHGAGGVAWGGHFDCPGPPIVAARPALLAAAAAILNPPPVTYTEEDQMHVNLRPGDQHVITSPTVVGGTGWLHLSSAFGDPAARVAFYLSDGKGGGGWTDAGTSHFTVAGNGPHWSQRFPSGCLKVTVEHKGASGVLSVDTQPDHPYQLAAAAGAGRLLSGANGADAAC